MAWPPYSTKGEQMHSSSICSLIYFKHQKYGVFLLPEKTRQRWLQNFSWYYCRRSLIRNSSTHAKAPSEIKILLDLLIGRNLWEWQIKGRTKAKPLNNKRTTYLLPQCSKLCLLPTFFPTFPKVNNFQKRNVSSSTITQGTQGIGGGLFFIVFLGVSTSFNFLSVLKYKAWSL